MSPESFTIWEGTPVGLHTMTRVRVRVRVRTILLGLGLGRDTGRVTGILTLESTGLGSGQYVNILGSGQGPDGHPWGWG